MVAACEESCSRSRMRATPTLNWLKVDSMWEHSRCVAITSVLRSRSDCSSASFVLRDTQRPLEGAVAHRRHSNMFLQASAGVVSTSAGVVGGCCLNIGGCCRRVLSQHRRVLSAGVVSTSAGVVGGCCLNVYDSFATLFGKIIVTF